MTPDKDGYIRISRPGHHRADSVGSVYEHIVVAEQKYGRPIMSPEEIHHIDEVKINNSPGNLFLCKDHQEHKVIHRRQRALNICGNPLWELCRVCKTYEDPENRHVHPTAQHLREKRSFEAIGDSTGRMCSMCKKFDLPVNLKFESKGDGVRWFHQQCKNEKKKIKSAKKSAIRKENLQSTLKTTVDNASISQRPGDHFAPCCYCKKFDVPEKLFIPLKTRRRPYHPECVNNYQRERRK